VGLGVARLGPLAAIGRAAHDGLDTLEEIGTEPAVTAAAFDPINGHYGVYPSTAKPDIAEGSTGEVVLYLEAVLVQRAGQALVAVDDLYGPDTTASVLAVQAFLSLPQTGAVDAATWQVIDLLASQPAP
jgi:peptidoglycan hydrolase-like protein with peptidoglycan-binding domain